MFLNVFFEGAIYLKFMVADYCGCCFILSCLLNSMVADLYFSSKFSPQVKILQC